MPPVVLTLPPGEVKRRAGRRAWLRSRAGRSRAVDPLFNADAPASTSSAPDSNHAFLRRTTRPWHDRVDEAYGRFDLASRPGLTAFLISQAAALLPMEQAIETCGAADFLRGWPRRRRGPALATDLQSLGLAVPLATYDVSLPSRLHGIGALYVLEGSKLGARVLLRRVAASPDADVRRATAFLAHSERGDWAAFLSQLDGLPSNPDHRVHLTEGAETAFAAFLRQAVTAGARCSPLVGGSQA